MEDFLDYPRLLREALRGVVREALRLAAERGLPGEHHVYVTFRTRHPGAVVPKPLASQHPDEMTIVLQNQFWELEVTHEAFSVSLRFGGTPQRLTVPFASVTAFADPAAQLGLRFEDAGPEETPARHAAPESAGPAPRRPEGDNVVDIGSFRKS
ncbi:MAG TPA: ClpXP protease specificity-enhancing factor SspB [Vicinamibacteria bacterium]|nr:ClpXP protease specificity-enhancing factor SspB [Vicinamibacteria bacterium]